MNGNPLSDCEKTFILEAASQKIRLDGRKKDEYRPLKIAYGLDWGNCLVTLGCTRVFAQVSCEIYQPNNSRPNEGVLQISAELAGDNKINDLTKINQVLERFYKDSKCIDLEALCIIAEEKVWKIKVDLSVLNMDGNTLGCCSIATLAALMHFRYPDVVSTGEKVVVYSSSERDPIPLSLHHHPVIASFAIFEKYDFIILDPSLLEDKVCDNKLSICFNNHSEMCGVDIEGCASLSQNLLMNCSNQAASVAIKLVDKIKSAIQIDIKNRSSKSFKGLEPAVSEDNGLKLCLSDKIHFVGPSNQENIKEEIDEKMVVDQDDVIKITEGTAFTASHNNLHQISKKGDKNDDLIVIDPESSESSSSDESIEIINHYKLDDIRPVIGKYVVSDDENSDTGTIILD
ncbi:3 exoribonuclease-like [Acyrthosiphon pisum]|uniref:Exosome complex component RRP45 n=1 Tax=Acyrthosiphon pisum TaxID=7029 RepID=C4WW91_ACYPI|nr:3 exoribonuclease-like [Acyrthosiphon pisum]BAH72161.1 ACYPI010191 [Acyrthosiphon pisum]|eukprot:NP_001155833.1 3 exoribonuclease-like [Acyrthosiphon pisum]